MSTARIETVSPKNLYVAIEGERYHTALSQLLAYDKAKQTYLFRALNSEYFVQTDTDEKIELLSDVDAEELYKQLPSKRELSLQAAFPRRHGGVGMATPTRYDDDA